jgi:hypothetical protein
MKHTITQAMFVHAEKQYGTNGHTLSLKVCDMSEYGYICLGNVEVSADYELPDDFNFTQCEIDLLRKEQKRILAESQKKVTVIEERIQSMLCLENKK